MKKNNFIYQMQPWIDKEEKQALNNYLDSGGWLTEFEKTQKFEKTIAKYLKSKYACVVTNGTISLFMALMALEIKQGDEVIVPNLTMIATANAVLLSGAKPILVDINQKDLCLDINLVKKAITKKTKAIILVNFNGRAPNMTEYLKLCQNGLHLIEDAAQAFGSKWNNKFLGTFGIIGSYSFSTPKIITTGQGGALVTNNKKIIEKLRKIKDFGRETSGIDKHITLGYNFKFTDLQASLGLAQMKKLSWRLQRKKAMFKLYQKQLVDVKQIKFIKTDLQSTSPWFIDILAPKRDQLISYLKNKGIGSRPFYPPIHTQAPYQSQSEYQKSSFPVSEKISTLGLWLPSSSFLSDKTIKFICQKIKNFYLS